MAWLTGGVPASNRCGGSRKVLDSMKTFSTIEPPVYTGGSAASTSRRPASAPIPVGPSILWALKTARSTPSAARSTPKCGTDWQASRTVSAPTSRALATSRSTGATVPSTLEACANASTLVRSVTISSSRSRSRRPSSVSPIQRNVAPVRRQACCHGTRLAWCSSSVTTTSSPARSVYGPASAPPTPYWLSANATRLRPSVAFRVQTSSSSARPTNAATAARACSYASVASSARVCAPRWTAAFDRVR